MFDLDFKLLGGNCLVFTCCKKSSFCAELCVALYGPFPWKNIGVSNVLQIS